MFEKKLSIKFELNGRSAERFENLKRLTSGSSEEVLKNALRLYEAIVLKSEEGAKFFCQMPGAETVPYLVFGNDDDPKEG